MENQKLTNLADQAAQAKKDAVVTYHAQLLASKSPALNAFQRGELTAEEYEQLTGETVAETLAQQFAMDRYRMRDLLYNRVKAGLITKIEYEGITGETYDPASNDIVQMMENAKKAAREAAETVVAEKAAAAEKVGETK